MNVELTPQQRIHATRGTPLDPVQYNILVDGVLVGFLPFHEGAKPLLFRKMGPIETREMMKLLRGKLNPHPIGPAVQPPDPPKPKESDDDYVDPFEALECDESED